MSSFDKENSEIIVTGDFNINLLKIKERPIFSEFFDILTSNIYLPKITLPTRFTDSAGTLIDIFFCKITNITASLKAGILTKKLSDHQPYIIFINTKISKPQSPKFITIRIQNEHTFSQLKNQIEASNIYRLLDQNELANPNDNYHALITKLSQANEKCMPEKIIKLNKHKHKKNMWITIGILKSINFKDKLHTRMKCTDPNSTNYQILKTNLRTDSSILKKIIRKVKQIHYSKTLLTCKK